MRTEAPCMDRLENAPGPRTRLPGGAYWVMRWLSDPLGAYEAMRSRFGDRFRMAAPKGWSFVLASSDAAREIVGADGRGFGPLDLGAPPIGAILGARSLFLLAGEAHRAGRRLLSP